MTNTSPAGDTAIVLAWNPRASCHNIVFPSTESFVTQEAAAPDTGQFVNR
jgi:hypothetical protein